MRDCDFEELVEEALAEVPARFRRRLRNVVFVVENEPPRPGLLGLYQGRPLTLRRVSGRPWYRPSNPGRGGSFSTTNTTLRSRRRKRAGTSASASSTSSSKSQSRIPIPYPRSLCACSFHSLSWPCRAPPPSPSSCAAGICSTL